LYLSGETQAMDRYLIEQHGVSGFTLMNRAARATFDVIQQYAEGRRSLMLICGGGNNGADGLLVAWLAAQKGWQVQCSLIADIERLEHDRARAYNLCVEANIEFVSLPQAPLGADWIVVDALLGIGWQGPVREQQRTVIEWINECLGPVIAVDMPSGLSANTGAALPIAVKASVTVTFITLKLGLLTHDGPDHAGFIVFNDLGADDAIYRSHKACAERLDLDVVRQALPARRRNSHKGLFGRVLVVGGDHGLGGAALMAAEASLASGAGLTSLATRVSHVSAALARIPEVMTQGITNRHQLTDLLPTQSVIVVGPGLGTSAWSQQLLQVTLESDSTLVLDADALNLLAQLGWTERIATRAAPTVITPHPGEASRLLGITSREVQDDRLQAALSLQQQLGAIVVLKGCGTLIAHAEGVFLCDYGNPGMASGGMGDILSGIIGAMMGQISDPLMAVSVAVCLHGAAADKASERGQIGLRATDLIPCIRDLLND
jgi:ADP-dependent NAD(P)H-hydrate dehydratase / NAD(P)H-hydrate epimerase